MRLYCHVQAGRVVAHKNAFGEFVFYIGVSLWKVSCVKRCFEGVLYWHIYK